MAIILWGIVNRDTRSDKDIILLYVSIAILLYSVVLTSSFIKRIYKWGDKSSRTFYIFSLPASVLSFVFLFQIVSGSDLPSYPWLMTISIVCGLNLLTYFWGLLKKVE
jgi:cellulose synthase/poly-beta-1,6-N-acetylglucosamine synthase-like glycosyltransferase